MAIGSKGGNAPDLHGTTEGGDRGRREKIKVDGGDELVGEGELDIVGIEGWKPDDADIGGGGSDDWRAEVSVPRVSPF